MCDSDKTCKIKKQNIFYFPELVVFRKKSTSFPRLRLKQIIIERR